MPKGSQFERNMSRALSLWWTEGKRDDVFWRVSQSGGRATQRMKSGRHTYGSYGDIAAIDPVGEPLLKLVTIELKRGRSHGHPSDLFECNHKAQQQFEKALRQAMRSARHAGTRGWMLISRPDRKKEMMYLDWRTAKLLAPLFRSPQVRYSLLLCSGMQLRFIGIPLKCFFDWIKPSDILHALTTK